VKAATDVTDVVVIGAGVAGLEAAYQLRRAGLRVIALEARERVGGRIETHHDPARPAPIDMGAEFIHGRPPDLLRALHDSGIRARAMPERHHLYRHGRLMDGATLWKRALELTDDLGHDERAIDDLLKSPAWRRKGPAEPRRLARLYLEGFNAAELSRASVLAIVDQQAAAERISGDWLGRPTGGYGALPLRLVEKLSRIDPQRGRSWLRLGVVVTRVAWQPGRVTVHAHAPDGTRLPPVKARAAVVSVPLGVLQARPPALGALVFAPGLPPPVRQALDGLAMGAVTKVVLRLNRSPWRGRAAPIGFVHVPAAPFPTFWSATDGPRPIIVAWAGGPAADRLHGLGELRLRAAATSTLARAFGWTHREFLRLVDGVLVRTWADDPFARGAYSYVKVGHRAAGRLLAAPIAGTLFLSGEATDVKGWSGTVHGALESGARVARDVVTALRTG